MFKFKTEKGGNLSGNSFVISGINSFEQAKAHARQMLSDEDVDVVYVYDNNDNEIYFIEHIGNRVLQDSEGSQFTKFSGGGEIKEGDTVKYKHKNAVYTAKVIEIEDNEMLPSAKIQWNSDKDPNKGKMHSAYLTDLVKVEKTYAGGGEVIKGFNPKDFSLEEIDSKLTSKDILLQWVRKGDSTYSADKRDFVWGGDKWDSKYWKKIKDQRLTMSDYGQIEMDKGSENLYFTVIIYEKDGSDEPMELQMYSKDNHADLKAFANSFITKMSKGGSTYAGGGEIKRWVGEKEDKGYPVYVRASGYPTQTVSYHKTKELAQKKVDSLGGSTYAGGGEIKYVIVNDDTDRIYHRTTDKKIAELKLREFQEIYPSDKIIIQEFPKGGSTYAGGGEIVHVKNDYNHKGKFMLTWGDEIIEDNFNSWKEAKSWAINKGYLVGKDEFKKGGSTYAGGGEITLNVDLVPYTFKDATTTFEYRDNNPRFKVENLWGTDGIDELKRKNGHGEASGNFYHYFNVYIEEDDKEVYIELYPAQIENNDGNIEDALTEAVSTISDYYDSVGWEFLSDPTRDYEKGGSTYAGGGEIKRAEIMLIDDDRGEYAIYDLDTKEFVEKGYSLSLEAEMDAKEMGYNEIDGVRVDSSDTYAGGGDVGRTQFQITDYSKGGYFHIIGGGENYKVMASAHKEPMLGGQILKGGFGSQSEAENWAKSVFGDNIQIITPPKIELSKGGEIDNYFSEGRYSNGDEFHLDGDTLEELEEEVYSYGDELDLSTIKFFGRDMDGREVIINPSKLSRHWRAMFFDGGEAEKHTYEDFDKDHDAFTDYVMNRIDLDTRREIRNDWNAQYNEGEKDWHKYLLSRVNKIAKQNGDMKHNYSGGGSVDNKIALFQKMLDDPRSTAEEKERYKKAIDKLKGDKPAEKKDDKKPTEKKDAKKPAPKKEEKKDEKKEEKKDDKKPAKGQKGVKVLSSKRVSVDGVEMEMDSQEFCNYLLSAFHKRREKAKAQKGAKKKTTSVMSRVSSNIEKGVTQAIKSGIKDNKEEIHKNPKPFINKIEKLETSTKNFLNDLKEVLGKEFDNKEITETTKAIQELINDLKKKAEATKKK